MNFQTNVDLETMHVGYPISKLCWKLMYAKVCEKLNIAKVVGVVNQFVVIHEQSHWIIMK